MNYGHHPKYDSIFKGKLLDLQAEGRYRTFANLRRKAGAFPSAVNVERSEDKDVTVWCSNDYLGMSQNPVVLDAMHAASEDCLRHHNTDVPFAYILLDFSLRPLLLPSFASRPLIRCCNCALQAPSGATGEAF